MMWCVMARKLSHLFFKPEQSEDQLGQVTVTSAATADELPLSDPSAKEVPASSTKSVNSAVQVSKKAHRPRKEKVRGVTWTYGKYVRSRFVTGALWVALAAGPAACVLAGYLLSAPAAQSAPTVQEQTVTDPGVQSAEAYAAQFASAYVSATQADHASLSLFIDASLVTLPQMAPQVTAVNAASSTKRPDGVYTVTVVVTQRMKPTDVTQPSTVSLHYLTVPIAVSDKGVVAAAGLPAYVAAPAGQLVQTGPANTQVSPTSPAGQTVGGFLTAYLSGSNDVTRYVSPGVLIPPVTPKVADQVQATQILALADVSENPADGATASLQATVQLTLNSQPVGTSTYLLDMIARGGRWEITNVNNQIQQPLPPVPAATRGQATTPSITSIPGDK